MSADMIPLITKAMGETVYMVALSMVIASIIGVPLGVLLHTTAKNKNKAFSWSSRRGTVVNKSD